MIELHAAPAHFNKHDSGPAAPESVAAIFGICLFSTDFFFLLDFGFLSCPTRQTQNGNCHFVLLCCALLLLISAARAKMVAGQDAALQ